MESEQLESACVVCSRSLSSFSIDKQEPGLSTSCVQVPSMKGYPLRQLLKDANVDGSNRSERRQTSDVEFDEEDDCPAFACDTCTPTLQEAVGIRKQIIQLQLQLRDKIIAINSVFLTSVANTKPRSGGKEFGKRHRVIHKLLTILENAEGRRLEVNLEKGTEETTRLSSDSSSLTEDVFNFPVEVKIETLDGQEQIHLDLAKQFVFPNSPLFIHPETHKSCIEDEENYDHDDGDDETDVSSHKLRMESEFRDFSNSLFINPTLRRSVRNHERRKTRSMSESGKTIKPADLRIPINDDTKGLKKRLERKLVKVENVKRRHIRHPSPTSSSESATQEEFDYVDSPSPSSVGHACSHSDEKPLKCTVCEETFDDKASRKRHMTKCHGPPFKKRLLLMHEGKKIVACETCGEQCTDASSLRSHCILNHKAPPLICEECGAKYMSPRGLQRHKMSHAGSKPFKCDTCGYGFKTKYELDKHVRTHTGERPFQCENCGKGFKTKDHLLTHVKRIHSKDFVMELKYECPHCDKAYPRKGVLEGHIRQVHTGERPFQCDVCKKGFALKTTLTLHLKSHGISPPDRGKRLERSKREDFSELATFLPEATSTQESQLKTGVFVGNQNIQMEILQGCLTLPIFESEGSVTFVTYSPEES